MNLIKKITLIIFSLFVTQSLMAQMQVAVELKESTGNKALVSIETQNGLGQDVRNARAWVFLFDAEGKVVGQKAQWLGGSEEGNGSGVDSKALISDGEGKAFTVVVDAQSKPVRAEITFSRIILADGTMVDIQKSVKPLKKAE